MRIQVKLFVLIFSCLLVFSAFGLPDEKPVVDPYAKIQANEKNIKQTNEQANKIADDVLSDNQFKPPPANQSDKLLARIQKIFSKITDAISKFLGMLFGNMQAPNITSSRLITNIVILVVILSVLTLLIWLTIKIRYERQIRGRENEPAIEELTMADPPDLWMQNAYQLAENKRYREAIRYAYIGSLSHMDRKGLIRFDKNKTNWEYVRQVQRSNYSELTEKFKPITLEYDYIWYGQRKAGNKEFDSFVSFYRQVSANLEITNGPS